MSNPSLTSYPVSDPSMRVVSDPSIRGMKKNTRILQISLVILVIVALVALGVTVLLFIKETEKVKSDALKAEEGAMMPRRINVQAISANDSVPVPEEDEAFVHFSLFSTPPGAEVYQDGLFLGTTPIDQRLLPKEDKSSNIVVVMEGHEIVRKTVRMNENFSDAVQLREVASAQPKQGRPQKAGDGVTANQAIIVTTQTSDKSSRRKRKGGQGNPGSGDIVLPD